MARIDLYQLDDFNDNFAPNKRNGDVAMWSTTSNEFVPIARFGNHYYRNRKDTPFSTSSTGFQIAHEYETPNVVPVGLYHVYWYGLLQTGNNQATIEAEVRENNVRLLTNNIQIATRNLSENWAVMFTTSIEVVTERKLLFDVYIRRNGASQLVYATESQFEVYQIL